MPKSNEGLEEERKELLEDFLNTSRLPVVSELKGCLVCNICREPYLSGTSPEVPIKIGCGHIFGQNCLLTWLNPLSDEDNNSCPICRESVFDYENEYEYETDSEEEAEIAQTIVDAETETTSANAGVAHHRALTDEYRDIVTASEGPVLDNVINSSTTTKPSLPPRRGEAEAEAEPALACSSALEATEERFVLDESIGSIREHSAEEPSSDLASISLQVATEVPRSSATSPLDTTVTVPNFLHRTDIAPISAIGNEARSAADDMSAVNHAVTIASTFRYSEKDDEPSCQQSERNNDTICASEHALLEAGSRTEIFAHGRARGEEPDSSTSKQPNRENAEVNSASLVNDLESLNIGPRRGQDHQKQLIRQQLWLQFCEGVVREVGKVDDVFAPYVSIVALGILAIGGMNIQYGFQRLQHDRPDFTERISEIFPSLYNQFVICDKVPCLIPNIYIEPQLLSEVIPKRYLRLHVRSWTLRIYSRLGRTEAESRDRLRSAGETLKAGLDRYIEERKASTQGEYARRMAEVARRGTFVPIGSHIDISGAVLLR